MAETKMTLTVSVHDLEPLCGLLKSIWDIRKWLAWHANKRSWPEIVAGDEPEVDAAKLRDILVMMHGWAIKDEEGAKADDEVAS